MAPSHDSWAQACTINLHVCTLQVVHGGGNDVAWLQRDFGIHLVNVFDTEKACQVRPTQGGGELKAGQEEVLCWWLQALHARWGRWDCLQAACWQHCRWPRDCWQPGWCRPSLECMLPPPLLLRPLPPPPQVLGFQQRSLAFLLQRYCGVQVDKSLQQADWRQRWVALGQIGLGFGLNS